MSEEIAFNDLKGLPASSRVWVYAAERRLTPAEVQISLQTAQTFARQWVSHNRQLQAAAALLHERFLVLAVNQDLAGASGCSIDSSVHFVQRLGSELGVDFFNRMIFHFRDEEGEVQSLDRTAFQTAFSQGKIENNTLVFDPLVDTLAGLLQQFEKPLEQSWHARML